MREKSQSKKEKKTEIHKGNNKEIKSTERKPCEVPKSVSQAKLNLSCTASWQGRSRASTTETKHPQDSTWQCYPQYKPTVLISETDEPVAGSNLLLSLSLVQRAEAPS